MFLLKFILCARIHAGICKDFPDFCYTTTLAIVKYLIIIILCRCSWCFDIYTCVVATTLNCNNGKVDVYGFMKFLLRNICVYKKCRLHLWSKNKRFMSDRQNIEEWFDAEGRAMLSASWCMMRDLYVECVLFTRGEVRCSDREFGQVLCELGCEYKRVAGGMAYRLIISE